ncbi:MAG TPA: Pyrroline-5-carboxylate reductase [Hyphomicrobiaceae bacterium MAG_BT-2024]
MGGALLTGWLRNNFPISQLIILDPNPSPEASDLIKQYNIAVYTSLDKLSLAPSVIIVAVKPQIVKEVFPPIGRLSNSNTLVISAVAGCTIESFEKHLQKNTTVVRSIPNTPASIGRAVTTCIANSCATNKQLAICDQIFSSVGEVYWIEDETLMDVITAVSGSGPAYIFFLAECLKEAAIKLGLSAELSSKIVNATVAGAGDLIRVSNITPKILLDNVTSTGGTTHSAMKILMKEDRFRSTIEEAVIQASRRCRELSE